MILLGSGPKCRNQRELLVIKVPRIAVMYHTDFFLRLAALAGRTQAWTIAAARGPAQGAGPTKVQRCAPRGRERTCCGKTVRRSAAWLLVCEPQCFSEIQRRRPQARMPQVRMLQARAAAQRTTPATPRYWCAEPRGGRDHAGAGGGGQESKVPARAGARAGAPNSALRA